MSLLGIGVGVSIPITTGMPLLEKEQLILPKRSTRNENIPNQTEALEETNIFCHELTKAR